jgi:hypothetical protein
VVYFTDTAGLEQLQHALELFSYSGLSNPKPVKPQPQSNPSTAAEIKFPSPYATVCGISLIVVVGLCSA